MANHAPVEVDAMLRESQQEENVRYGFLDYIIVAYILFLPVQFQTGQSIRIAPSDVFLVAYLAFGFMRLKFVKHTWSMWHAGLFFTFAMGMVVAIANTGYISQYAIIQKGIGLLVLFAAYLAITSTAADWAKIGWLLKALIIGVVFQNTIALVAFAASQLAGYSASWMNYGDTRLSGMLVDPNAYGGLLVLVFAIQATTYFLKRPLLAGMFGWYANITLGIGIILTFSRSAWIGMAIVLMTNAFISAVAFKPKVLLRLGLVGVFAVLALYVVFGAGFLDVFMAMATRQSQIQDRFEIIGDALAMFADSPVFGIGIGVFAETHDIIIHNTPLWILTEFGLLGFMLFLGFSLWFVTKGIHVYKSVGEDLKPMILGLVMAYMAMAGLSLGIEALYQRHWWLIMALLASSYGIVCRESRILDIERPLRLDTELPRGVSART
ncbi:MAG: O-antigen ligase family protein [Candidatus Aquicultor sp.]|nr:O-antigen ligase family protein [Candidatus Aquicultor sp.]